MKGYRKRIADEILKKKLLSKGAVLIQGAKWCGKTTTAEMAAKSCLYINDPKQFNRNKMLSDMDPEILLKGKNPRLIDEWQLTPKLWDAIRFVVDKRQQEGLFILTGSAVPSNMSDIHHTGTGRFRWMKMRPMSLYESGESTGDVSLTKLFTPTKEPLSGNANLTLEDIAFLISRGGWPMAVGKEEGVALSQGVDYYDAVVNEDISCVDGIKRDAEFTKRLMRSYARNQGSQASIETIVLDLDKNEGHTMCSKTTLSYINALKKIFVIEDMTAWNPNLRSKTPIRTSDTRYFVDPSIAVASLGIGPGDLINDLETMGLLFETLAVRDLRVYADAMDATVYHYRDKSELECDAVIHLRNGRYGLIEIKLGGDRLIEEGATSLKKLKERIDTTKMPEPSFLMVLTAIGDMAYTRPDKVIIVPIGALKN